jgi:peptidoglycan-associated lipoprotein
MRKIIYLALCLGLSLGLTNCASKKKASDDEGIAILQPDSGSDDSGNLLGGVSADGNVLDTTGVVDPGLSLTVSGSDTGKFEGLYTVNFEYDKARLTDESRALLASNVDWIKANPSKVVQLEGHCDERGSTEYNLALGDRRARSVKEYLTSLGVDSSKIIVISYGKEKPLSTGDSDSDHFKNRRVNFLPIDQ